MVFRFIKLISNPIKLNAQINFNESWHRFLSTNSFLKRHFLFLVFVKLIIGSLQGHNNILYYLTIYLTLVELKVCYVLKDALPKHTYSNFVFKQILMFSCAEDCTLSL